MLKRGLRQCLRAVFGGLVAALLPLYGVADAETPAVQNSDTSAKASDSIWTRDTLTGDWLGLRTRLEDMGVKLGLQEQSEVWGNLSGGLRRGVVYDGLTTASIAVDLEKMTGWTGAKFFVSAYQIHGSGPTTNLVGNLQAVSDIEARRDTKLYQLWIEQTLLDGHLSIRTGQGGINDEMMTSEYSALFLNAAFGLSALSTANLPSGGPSFPLATPFARVQFQPNDRITLMSGAFNGDPAPPGTGDPQLRDKGGTAFRTDAHLLAVAELWYSTKPYAALPGTYKIGAWLHSGHFADQLRDSNGVSLASPVSNHVPAAHSPDFAIYAIVDQMVWKRPGGTKQGIGAFFQATGSPGEYNLSNFSFTAGMKWTGPLEARENDVLGFAVSYLGISPAARRFGADMVLFTGQGSPYRSNETVVEATYQIQLTPWWLLQPDLQIIVNPGAGILNSAAGKPLNQSVISGLHSSITF